MIDNKLVLAYIGNGKSANRYHIPYVLTRKDKFKKSEDRQEEYLKMFIMPGTLGFGKDQPQHYGTLIYYDENNAYHEEKVPSVDGDYARVYDDIYECIVNGKEQKIKHWETLLQMEILEKGVSGLR